MHTSETGCPSCLFSRRFASRNSLAPNSSSCSGLRPPKAASTVGASGVIPTTWNSATAPEDAKAAPSALISSAPIS